LYDLFGAFGGGCQRQTKASKVVNAEILMCVNYPQTAKKNWKSFRRGQGAICISSFIADLVCFQNINTFIYSAINSIY